MDPKNPAKLNSKLRTPGLALSWVFSLLRRDSALAKGYGTRGLHPFGICFGVGPLGGQFYLKSPWGVALECSVPFGICLWSGALGRGVFGDS